MQILNIHTTKMRQFNLLGSDVDVQELAVETKNFSGAELEGLVRAAQSSAMNRHIKVREGSDGRSGTVRNGCMRLQTSDGERPSVESL